MLKQLPNQKEYFLMRKFIFIHKIHMYLILLAVSNTFAYFLCRMRLFRVTGVKPDLLWEILLPLLCACVSGIAASAAAAYMGSAGRVTSAACGIAVYIGIFALCLLLTSQKRVTRAAKAFGGGKA